MTAHELRDTWAVSGDELELFKETIADITNSTYVVDAHTARMTLLHFAGVSPNDPDKLMFTVHSKRQVEEKRLLGTTLKTGTLTSSGVTPEFIDELKSKSKLMMRLDNAGAQREDFYFTSARLARDLAARAQLAGDAVYDPTNERDIYIMSRYIATPSNVQVVIRRNSSENNAVQKIFAMPTMTYQHFDQRIILEMLDAITKELGVPKCQKWYIDHFITQLWVTFPDKADDVSKTYGLPDTLVPGVLMETSNTGDCSLRVIAFWERKRGVHARLGIYEREHRGRADSATVVADMSHKLMPNYTELPYRLCELLTIDIKDPTAAIEAVFHMANISKELGRKRSQNLLDAMTDLVSTRTSMTGYELAMMFMDLPSYDMDETVLVKAEQIAGKVPFLNFEKIAKSTTAVTSA